MTPVEMTSEQKSAYDQVVDAANKLGEAASALRRDPNSEAAKENRTQAGALFRKASEAFSLACGGEDP